MMMLVTFALAAAVTGVPLDQDGKWCVVKGLVNGEERWLRGKYREMAVYGRHQKGCEAEGHGQGLWVVEFQKNRDADDMEQVARTSNGVNVEHRIGNTLLVSGGPAVPAVLELDACGGEEGVSLYSVSPRPVSPVPQPSIAALRRDHSMSPASHRRIKQAVRSVSLPDIIQSLRHLQAYPTRNSYSTHLECLAWVAARYEAYGFDVTLHPFQPDMAPNVVATLPGKVTPSRVVVVGAHLDSRNTNVSDPTGRAPGVDDNGSGTSALLEIARVLHDLKLDLEYTLILCSFMGEEQGLLGSRALAMQWKDEGLDIDIMLNADMLGYTLDKSKGVTLGFKMGKVSESDTQHIKQDIIPKYVPGLKVADSESCCSDYLSFHDEGFRSVGFFENQGSASDYPNYHTSKDMLDEPTPEDPYVNPEQLHVEIQAFLATVLTYAKTLPARETEVLPLDPTFAYKVPLDVPGSAAVPGADFAVATVWDRLDAQQGWTPLNITSSKPKYLMQAHHDGDMLRLRRAYGADLAVLNDEFAVLATWEVRERKEHSCGNVLLKPASPYLRSATAGTGTVAPVSGTPDKSAFMQQIDSGLVKSLLLNISGEREIVMPDGKPTKFSTRYSFSQQNLAAATYMGNWMVRNGGCELTFQDFTVSGNKTRNVICVRPGSDKKNEVVVIGAHFDSISNVDGDSATFAPGAVDNGSGSVSVMAVAKALKNYQPSRTIHFILFSGEEQGLHGSTFYVEKALEDKVDIKAALIMDMTAYSNKYFGVKVEGTLNVAIGRVMANAVENVEYVKRHLGSELTHAEVRRSFGSDHVPFQKNGFPAILLIERDDTDYPGYHRTTDRVAYLEDDYTQLRDIARVILGQVVDYSA